MQSKPSVYNQVCLSMYGLLKETVKHFNVLNNLFQTDFPYNQQYLLLFST